MGRLFLILTTILLAFMGPRSGDAFGDVKSIDLPADFADFALNPNTGTLAAIDPDKNEIVFFRNAAAAQAGQLKPSASAKTGKTPVSVTFKQFGEMAVFAVVCSQDQNLFLYDAGGETEAAEDFTLLKKSSLGVDGVSLVFGSRNAKDPFLYYCFGSGHDSAAGVFSLRDLKNHGRAFGDAMDAAVSAEGDIIYVRGPWSPSGFNSLMLQNSLSDDKPEFGTLFHEHDSRGAYFPDPFRRMTIASNVAYDETLANRLGELPIVNPVFFQSPPAIVGFKYNRDAYRSNESPEREIQAASYNTLSALGSSIRIKAALSSKERNLPRGVGGNADFKEIARQTKLIADDRNNVVLLGDRNQLSIVPLTDLELPDEPLLLAELQGLDDVTIGRPVTLKVVTQDPRVKVSFDDLPTGMVANGSELNWTPSEDQVGAFTILATLEAEMIQKSITFDGEVLHPASPLPFNPSGMVVTTDGKTLYAWEGLTPADIHSRANGQFENPASKHRIAAIEAASGRIIAERKVAEPVSQIIDLKTHLLLLPADRTTGKCEILNGQTLERIKSLVTGGPIGFAGCFGDKLVVQTNSSIEIYELTEFRKVRQVSSAAMNAQGHSISPITMDGLVLNGVLYDETLIPVLNQNAGIFPLLVQSSTNFSFRSDLFSVSPETSQNSGHDPYGQMVTAKVFVPEANLRFTASVSKRQASSPAARFVQLVHEELTLTTKGAVDSSIVLHRKTKLQNQSGNVSRSPVVAANSNSAWVAFDKRLYAHTIHAPAGEDAVAPALRIQRKQSCLSLAKGDTTQLSHEVTSGKKPLEFVLRSPLNGMSIDEKSGILTIDNKIIQNAAVDLLFHSGLLETGDLRQTDDAELSKTKLATELLGEKPQGLYASLPVVVTATDADLNSDTLSYLVLVDIPKAEIDRHHAEQKAKLEELEKKRAQQQLANERPQNADMAKDSPTVATSKEIAELKTKIETLESRIDLLTRQLDELLKSLKK